MHIMRINMHVKMQIHICIMRINTVGEEGAACVYMEVDIYL
jgi:demethoxyubiquinone hydroxylase (CLK1/Coq7/Cat5 family)